MKSALRFLTHLVTFMLWASPAHAGPGAGIAAAAVAIAAAIGTSSVIVIGLIEILLYTAISVGLSYVARAIAGKPQTSAIGLHGTLEAGDDRVRSFEIGRFVTAGSLVYANTWQVNTDHPNHFLTIVIALGDIPITGLDKVFVGDTEGTYSTGGNTTANIPGYSIPEFELGGSNYFLWVKFYDGTQTAADPTMLLHFGSDPTHPYTSSMIGYGVPYVIVTCKYNPGIFSGFPKLRFECRGMKLYDPRLDTTNGGSGSHRYDTPSTWAYSDNPVVAIYNILRGIRAPTSSGTYWLYGLQTMAASRVPVASWFSAMTECDASINDVDGVPEAQYRCGGEIKIDVPPLDVIQEFLKCCQGRAAEIGGVYKILAGTTSGYVYSFTDANLMISESQQFEQFPSLSNTVNGINAKYTEPAEAWTTKDAPSLYDLDLEEEDGGRRLPALLTYNAVPYKSQVQRLMRSALLEARKFRKHTLALHPPAWVLEPNDIVNWNSGRNGYVDKLFRVEQVVDNDDLEVGVALVEMDPSDYDFDPDIDYRTLTVAPILPVSDTTLAAPTGLSVAPSFKSLYLTWANTSNLNLEAIEIWRSSSSSFGGAVRVADVAPDSTSWIDDGLTTITTYWYWIRYRNLSGLFSPYNPSSAGAGATGSTTVVGGVDIDIDLVTDALAAAGIVGVEVLAALPTTGNFDGRLVYLTADDGAFVRGKLYRYDSVLGAFTARVPTVDLTGTVTTAQIGDAQVTTAKIGDSQVTTTKIGDSQVSTAKIGDLQVTTGKLVDAAVTGPKLGDLAVTTGKIADLSITTVKIDAAAVTTAKITDAAIVASKIDALAVTTAKLDAAAVTTSKLAANAVTANEIAANTITADNMAANSIVTSSIVAGSVTTDKIYANAVTTAKIEAGAVTTSRLAVAAPGAALNSDPDPRDIAAWEAPAYIINGTNLYSTGVNAHAINRFPSAVLTPVLSKKYRVKADVFSGTGTNGTIYIGVLFYDGAMAQISTIYPAANGVSAANSWRTFEGVFENADFPGGTTYMAPIVYGNYGATVNPQVYFRDIRIEEVLPSTLIQNGAIITDKIAANAVVAAKIAALTITAAEIASNAITAAKILAGEVTAGKLAANAVTAGNIAADAVTAGVIAAGAIDAANIMVDNLIVTSKFVDLSVTTAKIANNAVTTGISVGGAGPTTLDETEVTILSGTYTGSGERVLVQFDIYYDSDYIPADEESGPGFLIYRDATLIKSFYGITGLGLYMSQLFWAPGGSAGSHTWYLKGFTLGPGENDPIVYDFTLEIKEWQK